MIRLSSLACFNTLWHSKELHNSTPSCEVVDIVEDQRKTWLFMHSEVVPRVRARMKSNFVVTDVPVMINFGPHLGM